MSRVVLGMAHRGRLNVLANVIGKSYEQIFREFEGELDPSSIEGSGDVKYHLGARGKHEAPGGRDVALTLAANPSHLEAVDPVVEGMARAEGDALHDDARVAVLPVLVHGDAAFAGQGVVAETFNLSEVPGYEVGGTVHIVVNNQLGFTTAPELGRSSVYPTDVAKIVQAPIFHVNGDDPEAAVRVIRLAFEFRQAFAKDVVVDLFCYRRFGHNEADEPAFTQPTMYRLIQEHPSVGTHLPAAARAARRHHARRRSRARSRLPRPARPRVRSDPGGTRLRRPELRPRSGRRRHAHRRRRRSSPRPRCRARCSTRSSPGSPPGPTDVEIHPKLERQLLARRTMFDGDAIDWALGEALAFGSLVVEGVPVRLAGQDTRRGTFSQRHGVLVGQDSEHEYVPLAHIADDQAPFLLYDTVLSEYAALGFEYGYSVASDALVCWEAQFGDFANGAQIVIDQFVVAAADKWGQRSSLSLLLPHGFEGQGPEHSSARIERYLTLCAEDNLRVVYPSTSAQYFHALRRQAVASERVPLVCFTPKRYLRMSQTHSPVVAFTDDTFHVVLDDPSDALDADAVTRVVLCTGKIGHELIDARDAAGAPVAIVRVEQLYPWPEAELLSVLCALPVGTRGDVGAGGAVEHGRVDVRRRAPPRHRRRSHRAAWSPRAGEREPRVGQREGPRPRAARPPRRRPRLISPSGFGVAEPARGPVSDAKTRVGLAEGAHDGLDDVRRELGVEREVGHEEPVEHRAHVHVDRRARGRHRRAAHRVRWRDGSPRGCARASSR